MRFLVLLALAGAASAPAQPASRHPADSATDFMGAGIARQLAEHRAATLSNVRYALDLDVTRADTAFGTVTIAVNRRGIDDLIVDFRGIALDSSVVNGRAAGVEFNGAHIRVPAARLHQGENTLRFAFRTPIAPAGASIIRYRDTGDSGTYLYTLLVPADANLLFPSFDQPDLKARVTLTLRTPIGWRAVTNGPLLDSTHAGGALVHRFSESHPISTYLIAFAAGPWAVIESKPGTRPVKLFVRQSRAKEVEADTLLALNQRALDWLEQYFGRPFPFAKYDMVLAPAFPFGGMEHPGAVFYNEDSFIFRERPTLNQKLGREATTYHEVAHQWFGDLVTMRWFDDLWLKEGFATYMAAKMQDALSPDANAWKTFYLRNKPAAYAVDATSGTTPVWQELGNLDQAKSNYGAIVYNKAPSVLKQLDYLVGDSAFQNGVRAFLDRHAYANATWRELLAAIGEAAGRPLTDWGAQYILRSGMPVLTQHAITATDKACPAGDRSPIPDSQFPTACLRGLTLIQRPAQPLSGEGTWPMRVEVLFGDSLGAFTRVPVEISAGTTVVVLPENAPPARFAFANARDYGYGTIVLDSVSTGWLLRNLGAVGDDFQRAMLWGALWDLVRAAELDPRTYVSLALRELPRERDEQIVASALGRMGRAVSAYLGDAQRAALIGDVERALWRAAADTARAYGIRKSHLDAFIGLAETPAGLATLDSLLDQKEAAGAPFQAPTRWAIVNTLLERGAPGAARRLTSESRRDSTTDGRRRAFAAGAAVGDPSVKAQYFRRYFADSTLNEEWATASLGNFNATSQSALTMPYLVPALDSLPWIQRNRRIFYLGSWLGSFLGGQTSGQALAQVDDFLTTHPDLPLDLRRKILQSADELRRTVAIRRRFASVAATSATQ